MMRFGRLVSVAAAVVACAWCSLAAENLVVNGDFEAAGYTENFKENCGSAYLIGWTCSQAGICTPQGTYLRKDVAAYNNTAWAFLKKASSIKQDVVLAVPGTYRLAFDYCLRDNCRSSASTFITLGEKEIVNIVGDADTDSAKKPVAKSYDFVIDEAGTYSLKFEQKTTVDASPAFDNISLTLVHEKVGLLVRSVPTDIGVADPTFGFHAYDPGTDVACASSSEVVDGNVKYLLTGWLNEAGGTVTSGGPTNIVLTTRDGLSQLTWLWDTYYRVTAAAGAGGTASVAAEWVKPSGNISVTAVADAGYVFTGWTGTVPAGMTRANPLSFPPTAAVSVTANFAPVVTKTVKADGSGDYATISAALAALKTSLPAGSRGEVVVEPGVYALAELAKVEGPITVRSSTGKPADVLVWADRGTNEERWRPKRSVFSLEHADAMLSGLTVSNGYSSASKVGGGVAMTAAATIDNCHIIGNLGNTAAANIVSGGVIRNSLVADNKGVSSGQTGGLYVEGGTVVGCTIINNRGEYSNNGIGVNINGGTISGCVITNNFNSYVLYAQGAGGVYSAGTVTIERTLIAGNAAGESSTSPSRSTYSQAGGIFVGGGTCTISHCTIADNIGVDWGGIRQLGSTVRVSDSIVWRNLDMGYSKLTTGAANVVKYDKNIANIADANIVRTCTTIDFGAVNGNKTCDPLFVDADAGDYRLAANSPCLGMGYTDETGPSVVVPELQSLVEVKPGDDLRAKVALCADGGTVKLADGAYPVSRVMAIDRGIRIESANGPEKTSIYSTKTNERIFNADHPDFVLSGVTVSNVNFTSLGIAVCGYVRGGTITNCVFTLNKNQMSNYGGGFVEGYDFKFLESKFIGNTGGGGHRGSGIALSGSSSLLQGCEIVNNRHDSANAGGSHVTLAGGTMNRCVVTNNYGTGGSIGITVCNGTGQVIQNTVVARNRSPYSLCPTCGINVNTTGVRIENCTIVGNEGTKSAGLQLNGKNVQLKNVISYGNTASAGSAETPNIYSATAATVKNCFFELASEHTGANFTNCQSGDPKFTDYAAGDYTLTSASNCRNKGATDVVWAEDPALDVAGLGRVNEEIPDIGAYEFYAPPGLHCEYAVSGNDVAGGDVTFTATVTGDQTGLEYRWNLDGTPGAETGWTDWSASPTLVLKGMKAGSHGMVLQVRNEAGDDDETDMDGAKFAVSCPRLYLVASHPDGETATAPYDSWATAATNIADLLVYCGHGTDISVADGNHLMKAGAKFTCAVKLHGTNRAETAALSRAAGYGMAHMLNFSVAGSTLSCLSVSNAQAEATANFGSAVTIVRGRIENCIFAKGQGCLVGNENSTVVGCVFRQSTGGDREPTGYWQRGDEAFTSNCVMTANTQTYYASGTVRVEGGLFTHCKVVDNTMDNGGTAGCPNGGIQLVRGTVAETLVAGNSCNEGAAALQFSPSVSTDAGVVVNCTFVSNSVNKAGLAGLVMVNNNISGRLFVTNTIFYGNRVKNVDTDKTPVTREWVRLGSKLSAIHCLMDSDAAINAVTDCSAEGCFYADPRFRTNCRQPWRLQPSSPCVDAGVVWPGAEAATDLYGRLRKSGRTVDIGCSENGDGLVILVR